MVHQKLLIGMIGLLLVVSGGIFVLVSQGGEEVHQVELSSLVAGARLGTQEEIQVESSQEERTISPVPQPRPPKPLKPVGQPRLPSPVPVPAPVPSPISAPPPEPASVIEPSPPPSLPPPAPAPQPQPAESPPAQPSEKININTAGYEELQEITGVGSVIAQRIIDYRNANGPFQRIEDIKNVSGIGDATFEKMKGEITVGDVGASPPPPPRTSPPSSATGKININTASFEELQQIIGVGEVIAQRIIDYRNQNGPFQKIEDIKNVKGIGDVSFEKMRDEITI